MFFIFQLLTINRLFLLYVSLLLIVSVSVPSTHGQPPSPRAPGPRPAEKIAGDPQKILPDDLKKWPEKFFKNDLQNFSTFVTTFTKQSIILDDD